MTNVPARAKAFGLPPDEFAVFGSALLDVWGIRPAADLDIIATPALFRRLRDEGWSYTEEDGVPLVSKGDANVCTVQPFKPDAGYNPDREQLIRDAVVIDGVRFVRIEEVILCKRDYDRQKDRDDIASIARYLAGPAGDAIYASNG